MPDPSEDDFDRVQSHQMEEPSKIQSVSGRNSPLNDTLGSIFHNQRASCDEKYDPNQLQLKFEKRSTSVMSRARENVLAIPKPQYQGKDFFQRQEFRGLLLADH